MKCSSSDIHSFVSKADDVSQYARSDVMSSVLYVWRIRQEDKVASSL